MFNLEGVLDPRVLVPNNTALGAVVLVVVVEAWGKYMSIEDLDP